MWYINFVVVVLPLLPVIPIINEFVCVEANSNSDIILTLEFFNLTIISDSFEIPGLFITKSEFFNSA